LGVSFFENDPVSNAWLLESGTLQPSKEVEAIKLRTNTVATREAMKRGRLGREPPLCRRCSGRVETLGHILGQCVSVKGLRIRRHDAIVDRLQSHFAKLPGVRWAREQQFSVGGARLKPDLVVALDGVSYVLDVTVRFEVDSSLTDAHTEKLSKYEPLLPQVRTMFSTENGKVLRIVVGARVALPKRTEEALAEIGLGTRGFLRIISEDTLKASLNMLACFMDYGN
jgi:hypothetical protein